MTYYSFQDLERNNYTFNLNTKRHYTGIEIYQTIIKDYKHYGSIRNIKIVHLGKILKYSDTVLSSNIFYSARPFLVIYKKTDWRCRRNYLLHRYSFRTNIGLKPY